MSAIWSGSSADRRPRRLSPILRRLSPWLRRMGIQMSRASTSWILPLRALLLAVGDDPDVSADAGVVEHLLRQGDDGFEPVVLDDPLADFALAAARAAGEQRRAGEDDGQRASRASARSGCTASNLLIMC